MESTNSLNRLQAPGHDFFSHAPDESSLRRNTLAPLARWHVAPHARAMPAVHFAVGDAVAIGGTFLPAWDRTRCLGVRTRSGRGTSELDKVTRSSTVSTCVRQPARNSNRVVIYRHRPDRLGRRRSRKRVARRARRPQRRAAADRIARHSRRIVDRRPGRYRASVPPTN